MTLAAFAALVARSDSALPGRVLLVRHDVDSDVSRARRMREIERGLGTVSTYFFRRVTWDVAFMRELQSEGCEVGYHYEELATLVKERGATGPGAGARAHRPRPRTAARHARGAARGQRPRPRRPRGARRLRQSRRRRLQRRAARRRGLPRRDRGPPRGLRRRGARRRPRLGQRLARLLGARRPGRGARPRRARGRGARAPPRLGPLARRQRARRRRRLLEGAVSACEVERELQGAVVTIRLTPLIPPRPRAVARELRIAGIEHARGSKPNSTPLRIGNAS